ncbi:MAG TPA: flagellar export protein FliJ [Candidatus Limnocylindria bacterium]|nr:flagellar export protein FliJ [Candidatus Limnocylindria bacterium]
MSLDSERLDLLVRVADSKTENAAKDLLRQRAHLRDQVARLDELCGYLSEYRSRPIPASPQMIANRERFLARLAEAETQQRKIVAQAEAAVEGATRSWGDRRRDGEKFETLQQGAQAREAKVEERRAQGGLDEFAVRGFVKQRAALHE